ncbi:MAG TPA: EamA family transporter [Terriglobales bacterium]|nr:EamA family transporter [Terriglobales bacterium]
MPPKAHPVRGYLYIGTATFFWGISATLGRAVFTGRLLPGGQALRPIDPLILAQSRTTFSFLVLFSILFFLRRRRGLQLPRKDLLHTILLGILGVAASNYFYYLAIQKTNVATAIILQYTAPAWVLLYLVARGQQKATVQRVAAVAFAVVGSALAIGVGGGGLRIDTLGLIAAMLASFSFAFYNVGGHDILARYDRWKVLLYTLGSAAAFWIVVDPPWKIAAAHYGGGQWLFLVLFAITSVLLPFSLYFAGLQHLDATSAIVGSCLEPVFSIVIAAIVLGEGVRPLQALGVIVVLAAIVLVQMPDRATRQGAALVEPME